MIDLIGHIQPPAVYTDLLDPILRNLQQVGLHFMIGGVELRHIAIEAERIVRGNTVNNLSRKRIHMEPVAVDGEFAFFQNILKWRKFVTAVVEHGVQHDTDATFVAFFYDLLQQLIIAEMRVDFL